MTIYEIQKRNSGDTDVLMYCFPVQEITSTIHVAISNISKSQTKSTGFMELKYRLPCLQDFITFKL